MELRHLRYFEALASTLNFTRAAERLHIAQPPLSRQIQQLEEEVGVPLIDRSARPLALTRAGAFFYEQATQVLTRIEEVTLATRRLGVGRRRWIGIGFVPSMLYGELPNVVRRFMDDHPDLDVLLSELTSVQQVEALKAGRIDVGFGRVAIDAEGVVNTLIKEEPLVAALPAGIAPARTTAVSLRWLAEQTVVLYPSQPRPSFADQVMHQFRMRGCKLSRTFETNGLQTAIGLVAAGVGITIVPSSVQRLQRDDVVYRAISDREMIAPMLMTTRAGDPSGDLAMLCAAMQEASVSAAPKKKAGRARS